MVPAVVDADAAAQISKRSGQSARLRRLDLGAVARGALAGEPRGQPSVPASVMAIFHG